MQIITKFITTIGTLLFICLTTQASAQSPTNPSDNQSKSKLFAVEIKVGPNWDHSKAAYEQAFFKEHSANLKTARKAGAIVMGARYSDIGLIVFSAGSKAEVTAIMDKDPSMSAGTFKYEVHPMNVFYPGLVQSKPSN